MHTWWTLSICHSARMLGEIGSYTEGIVRIDRNHDTRGTVAGSLVGPLGKTVSWPSLPNGEAAAFKSPASLQSKLGARRDQKLLIGSTVHDIRPYPAEFC